MRSRVMAMDVLTPSCLARSSSRGVSPPACLPPHDAGAHRRRRRRVLGEAPRGGLCTPVGWPPPELPCQPAEHGVDQGVDVGVGEWGVVYTSLIKRFLVRDQEPVIERAVERVQHDVRVEAGAEFADVDPAADDLAGDLSAGLHPPRPDRLPQVRLHLRPAEQRAQELPRSNCCMTAA